jgi:hypothetical protein
MSAEQNRIAPRFPAVLRTEEIALVVAIVEEFEVDGHQDVAAR